MKDVMEIDDSMKNCWQDETESHPPELLAVLMLSVKQHAVVWIDANKPKHWARSMLTEAGIEAGKEIERIDDPTTKGVMYRVGYEGADGLPHTLSTLHTLEKARALVQYTKKSGPGRWFADPVEWEEHMIVPVIGPHIDVSAESFELLKTPAQIRTFVAIYLTNESAVGEVRTVTEDSEFDWRKHDVRTRDRT